MKIKHILALSLLSTLTLAGCSEDFLVENKIGEQTVETFYQNEEQAIKATNAAYSSLWDYRFVTSMFPMGDITSDDATKGSEPGDLVAMTDLKEFVANGSNTMVVWKWPRVFQGINKANQAIVNLPNVPMNQKLKDRLIGEAKFLRAYYYFEGVRLWGDLPIMTEPVTLENVLRPRAPKAEVYKQIEQDLLDAEKLLWNKSEYAAADAGRATKGAATALLMKAYLYQKKWADAKTAAERLFAANQYGLEPNFAKIFSEAGENGVESIFEIQFANTGIDNSFTSNGNFSSVFYGARGGWGWGHFQPTHDLYMAYEAKDPRRDATLMTVEQTAVVEGTTVAKITNDMTNYYPVKFLWEPAKRTAYWRNSPINERIIRLADVYLMYAEACYHAGDQAKAREYVNLVRKRARDWGGDQTALPDVTASGTALLDAIYQERRVELALEHHRFFDLVRTGQAEKVLKTVGYFVKRGDAARYKSKNFDPAKHGVFPIYQADIDASNGLIKPNDYQ